MENEVVIHVRTDDRDARAGFDHVEREARRVGKSAGDSLHSGISGKLLGAFSAIGNKLTSTLATAAGKLPGIMGSAVSALPPQGQAVALALVGGLAAALGPLLAAAISSAVLVAVGGGVLAAGIALVAKDSRVKSAFKQLGDSMFDRNTADIEKKIEAAQERFEKARALGQEKGMKSAQYDIDKAKKELAEAISFNKSNFSLRDLAEPFVEPLRRAAKTFAEGFNDLKPVIGDMFRTLAPVIDKLAPALVGFLKAAMPGIAKAAEAAVPLFNTLAEKLPKLGTAISYFFEKIAGEGDEANEFFGDLLDFVIGLIAALGDLIAWLTSMYTETKQAISGMIKLFTGFGREVINIFGNILDAAVESFGWMPVIGDKLREAQGKFREFRDKANTFLDGIDKNVTVNTTFKVFGKAAADAAARTAAILAGVDHNNTITTRFRVIGAAAARAAIDTANILDRMGYSAGGIVGGAATGGIHSGLRWVGENGPELLKLPPGAGVSSNADSRRMAGQGAMQDSASMGGPVTVNLVLDGQTIATAVLPPLQRLNRSDYGGDVTRMFPATR